MPSASRNIGIRWCKTMNNIKLRYHILLKDFVTVNLWAGLERTPVLKWLYRYVFYGLDLVMLVFAILSHMPVGFYVFLFLLGLFPLSMRLLVISKAKKLYQSNKIFQEYPITMTVGPDGIEESFFTHSYKNPWTELRIVAELKDIFVLMVENARVLYIPKNAFKDGEMDTFRALVQTALPKKRIHIKSDTAA